MKTAFDTDMVEIFNSKHTHPPKGKKVKNAPKSTKVSVRNEPVVSDDEGMHFMDSLLIPEVQMGEGNSEDEILS